MAETSASDPTRPIDRQLRRGFWLRQIHRWHWISSAFCLVTMLLFAATGITLNHAADISADPVTVKRSVPLDAPARAALAGVHLADGAHAPLPAPVARAVEQALRVQPGTAPAEWSEFEAFVQLPRPGGDATLTIDREAGTATLETTDRGWVAYLNDLHKGRNTGTAWNWFIDLFAVCCLVFTITGLLLLQLHGRNRPATWPVVGFGLLVPVLLVLLLVHR